MTYKQKTVEKSLKKKGVLQDDKHHHYFHYHDLSGRKTRVYTYTSHGSQDIDDYLIGKMAKQCCISKPQFKQLIDCPLKQPDYESILIAKGII